MAEWDVGSDPAAPKEAIAWFRKRVPLLKAEWAALVAAVKPKALTVAGVAQLDLVAEVQTALGAALAKGTTFADFKKAVGAKLEAEWGKKDPRRLETIFRTNLQSAYSAGRHRQMTAPAVMKGRPWWLFDAVIDAGTTEVCRGLNGLVMPANDPRWRGRTPPLHFACRSGIRTLTTKQAEARGIFEGEPPHAGAEGFGMPPDDDDWKPRKSKYPPEFWAAYEDKTT